MADASERRAAGVAADVWGPSLWQLLHTIGFKATAETVPHAVRLLRELQYIIPCKVCRKGYQTFYVQHPPLSAECDPEVLARWLWQCHDVVNQKLEKPYKAYCDIKKRYDAFHSQTSDTAVLDFLVLSSLNASDSGAKHIAAFAQNVACSLSHILPPDFCELLARPMDATSSKTVRESILKLHTEYHTARGIPCNARHHAAIVTE